MRLNQSAVGTWGFKARALATLFVLLLLLVLVCLWSDQQQIYWRTKKSRVGKPTLCLRHLLKSKKDLNAPQIQSRKHGHLGQKFAQISISIWESIYMDSWWILSMQIVDCRLQMDKFFNHIFRKIQKLNNYDNHSRWLQ